MAQSDPPEGEPGTTDLLHALDQKTPSDAERGAPRRDVVSMKLLQILPGLRSANFSDAELRVASELIVAGARNLDDEGKDEEAIWGELDAKEAAEAKYRKRGAVTNSRER